MEHRSTPHALEAMVTAALGRQRRLLGADRLRGGSKKGVYRLHLDDGATMVAYVWGSAENYWPDADDTDDPADPLSPASGLGVFVAAHRRLEQLGVRTPRLHWADDSGDHHPSPVAVVEDVTGPTLESLLGRDPDAAARTMRLLADGLAAMQTCESAKFGKVALVDGGGSSRGRSCEQVVHDSALGNLDEAARREPRLAAVRHEVTALLDARFGEVAHRQRYGLIHGELGPDHVLVDDQGRPALIDIEGLMFFDLEWEHVFLRLRFGSHYGSLEVDGLDAARLALYSLAMRLSLVAGPLRLLDGDFPDREAMAQIAEQNLQRVLDILAAAARPA